MRYYGSCSGRSGASYQFDKNQIITAPDNEFEEKTAEDISGDFEERKVIEINGDSVETSSFKKRGRPKKNK